jgi:hypothetical protein
MNSFVRICVGRIPEYWPEFARTAGIRPVGRNLGLPDSGDIDRMLSDFGTGKILMMVDCLK